MSALRQRGLPAMGLGGCVCIKTEKGVSALKQRRVCLHWDREGVPALRQRECVCIKTESVCLHSNIQGLSVLGLRGVSEFKQRGSVCIGTRRVYLH